MWVKVDDGFTDHPKIEALSDRAFRLHVAAMCYAGRTLSDGLIPKGRERMLINGFRPALLRELVDAGAWVPDVNGHRLHDYLEYNPSADHVKAEREYARLRKELYQNPQVVKDIRARDGNHCRYCGSTVNWTDRRGPRGATYDHVIPRGPNTFENVVVSCRGCNASKGSRTPEAAGMPLLDPGSKSRPSSGTKSDLATRPDPARPEGSRAGVSEEPSAMEPPAPAADGGAGSPERMLPEEQVQLNVDRARAAREALKAKVAS